jgi:hypothetical protein
MASSSTLGRAIPPAAAGAASSAIAGAAGNNSATTAAQSATCRPMSVRIAVPFSGQPRLTGGTDCLAISTMMARMWERKI